MRAYSEDLRKKIAQAVERGMPKARAARLFDVSLSSVKLYSRTATKGGSLEPRKSPGRPPKTGECGRGLLSEVRRHGVLTAVLIRVDPAADSQRGRRSWPHLRA